jgi:hypothetical protein
VLILPITRTDCERFTGVETLERQSFQFVLRSLLGANQALDVSLNGKSFGLRPGAKSCCELGMKRDDHK